MSPLIQFATILWRITLLFVREINVQFSFIVILLTVFGVKIILA